MKTRVMIVGASGHARVIADALLAGGTYALAGFATRKFERTQLMERPVVDGDERLLAALDEDNDLRLVVGIGDNSQRQNVVERLAAAGFGGRFVAIVHPSAVVGRDVEMGVGTVVLAGAVINTGTKLGRHVVVNTRSSVDHDCEVGDYVSVSPGATLGGNVVAGRGSMVGLGASVLHGRSVGPEAVVGAGSVVVRDIAGGVVAYGVPARAVRNRRSTDPYL